MHPPVPVTYQLPLPAHFSFQEALWFLDRNYDDCLHRVLPTSVRRAVRLVPGRSPFLLEVSATSTHLLATVLQGSATEAEVLAYLAEWFDLARDLAPFYQLLSASPVLGHLPAAYHGLHLMRIPDLFEALGWSIIGQQINLSFAYTLKRRLTEAFGECLVHQGHSYWTFPLPEVLAAVPPEALQALQFSRSKARYLTTLAQAFADGTLQQAHLAQLPDDAAYQALVALSGIGPWTANYALLKGLGRIGAIPHGDSGLIRAVRNTLGLSDNPTPAQINDLLAHTPGWAGYTVIYLWRSLSGPGVVKI